MIPFHRNEELIHRQDIISELDRILPLSDEYSAAALYGLGGSGKTQIALDYAYRRAQIPSCSVFWVHADNETTFTQDFKSIAKKLGLPSNLVGENLLMAVRHGIESNRPWVLVLDNADNLRLFGVSHTGQDALNLGEHGVSLDRFIPRGPKGQVLWTSRDERIAGGLVAIRRAINVPKMTPNEAKELFNSVRNNPVDDDEEKGVAALLDELEWLPLAISQAAAYMRRTLTTVDEYLSKLKDGKKRWRILKQSQSDRHRRREVSNSILETWSISMKHIQIENKTAYQILHIHAFLDNQNIPAELIEQAALYGDDSNGMDHIHETRRDDSSSTSDSDDDKVTEAIARLCEFSFLSMQVANDGNRAYKMHKLVQEAMRYGLGRKERKSEENYFSAAALEVAYSLFPRSPYEGWEVWSECEKYITHAQQACEWATLCGGDKKAAKLLSRLSRYLRERGRWRECEIVAQRAYELKKTIRGDKHLDTINSMEILADTYSAFGKHTEVEKMRIEIHRQRREILGDKNPETIKSEVELAITYHIFRRYILAEEIMVRALTLQQEILGSTHHDTIMTMGNLAITYQALGKYKEAEKMIMEVLAIQEETFGHKHHITITAMANISAMHQSHGRYQEAETLMEEVLALRREILGDQDPNTIMAMANLGITYCAAGKYKEAEEIQAKALALLREVFSDKHPDTIRSMENLGTIYHALGRYQEAETLMVEVLALRQEVLGNEHPDTMRIMGQLAETRPQLQRLNIEES
ncbi:P-loop containing nucleoside triphosphate hydrolase protein [Trichoderma pleuroticola]